MTSCYAFYYFTYKAPRKPVAPFLGWGSILIPGAYKRAAYAIPSDIVGYNIHTKWPLFRTLFIELLKNVDITMG